MQRSISQRLEIQFLHSNQIWFAAAEDLNGKFQVPQSLEEKQRMMYYLTNFHLQCWFLSPANCLQTHFRVHKDIECHASVGLHWCENHVSYSWAKTHILHQTQRCLVSKFAAENKLSYAVENCGIQIKLSAVCFRRGYKNKTKQNKNNLRFH